MPIFINMIAGVGVRKNGRGWCPHQLHTDVFRWRPRQQFRRVGEDAERPISLVVGGDANHGKWNDHASRDQMRIKGRSPDIAVAREGVNTTADPAAPGSGG